MGRYNAYWRGQNLVHPGRLADWGCAHEGLGRLARSPLFEVFQGGEPVECLLRDRDEIECDRLYLALRYDSQCARVLNTSVALPRVAATGTWEAVEYLWNAVALLALESPADADFDFASYLPSAIALWACTPSGSRAGPLLWALMRKHLLDGQQVDGMRPRWEMVDLQALISAARDISPARTVLERHEHFTLTRMEVPPATQAWIEQSRPDWGHGVAPRTGHVGTLQLSSMLPGLHANAWALIRSEFGDGEVPIRAIRRRRLRTCAVGASLCPRL